MIDPNDILEAYVGKLRSVYQLVDLLTKGDPDATPPIEIYEYAERGPFLEAIPQLAPLTLLVVYEGFGPGAYGQVPMRAHQVSVYFRTVTSQEARTLSRFLVDGVPTDTDEGLPLSTCTILPGLDQNGLPTLNRAYDPIEYWQLTHTLTEIGG